MARREGRPDEAAAVPSTSSPINPLSPTPHTLRGQRSAPASSHKRERSPGPSPAQNVFPLTKLTLGMWTSRRARLSLLMLEGTLLVLVERKEDRGMNGTPLGKRAALWKRAVGTLPSPFHQTAKAALQESHTPGPTPEKQRPPGFFFHKQASQAQTADGVISFELPVKDIVGLDYRNPLLQDGRLALEMRTVRKREFASREDAVSFYSRFSPDGPPAPSAAKEDTPVAFKGDTPVAFAGLADSPIAGLASPPAHAAGASPLQSDLVARRLRFDPNSNSTWVPVSQVFRYRTVQLEFADPLLPGALARLVSDCTRLLRLSESGISAWALFLPTFGLFYRPWMRRVAAVLWVMLGIFSVACGFLELYRNIPGAKQAIAVLYELSGFPDALTWLESHASVRLSILATYMLSKSQLLEWAVLQFAFASRITRSAFAVVVRPFRLVGGSLRPLLDFLSVVVAPVAAALSGLAAFVADVLQPVWLAVQALLLAPLRLLGALLSAAGPLVAAGVETCRAGAAAATAVWRSFSGVLDGVVRPLLSAAKATQAAGSAVSPGRSLLAHGKTLWDEIFSGLWRGTRAILLFSSHLAVSLNKHRLSISIAVRARWDRTAGSWLRWVAASASGLRGAAAQVSLSPEGKADSPRAENSPGGSTGSPRWLFRGSSWARVDSGLSGHSSDAGDVWTDDLGGPATATAGMGGGGGGSAAGSRGRSPAVSRSGSFSVPPGTFGPGRRGSLHFGSGGGGSPGGDGPGAASKSSFWASLTAAVGSAAHWADAEAEEGGHWAVPPRNADAAESSAAPGETEGCCAAGALAEADAGGLSSAPGSASDAFPPESGENLLRMAAAAAAAAGEDALGSLEAFARFSEGCAGGSTSAGGDSHRGSASQSHSPVVAAAVPRRPRTGSAASLKQRRSARRRDVGTTTGGSGDDPPMSSCRGAVEAAAPGGAVPITGLGATAVLLH